MALGGDVVFWLTGLTSLTSAEKARLRKAVHMPNDVLQAQVNIIAGQVETSIGRSSAEVRQMADDSNRWTAVEDEVQSLLDGLQGANLLRRHALVLIASQASAVGAALARDPSKVAIVSQVKEIRRLRRQMRRRKSTPETPSPNSGDPKPAQE